MLLTGRNPLDDKDDKDNETDHERFMDQEVAKFLARMQAQKAEERPASAQEVLNGLEDIARRRGISQLVPAMQAVRGAPELHRDTVTSSLAATMAAYAPSISAPPPPPPAPRKRLLAGWFVGGLLSIVVIFVFGSTLLRPASTEFQPAHPIVSNTHTLTIGEIGTTHDEVLDPALPLNMQDLQIEDMLYAGLTSVDGHNQIVPGLAQSWNAQPDATTGGLDWTFHLRPNLKFSNGDPLTSADIAYSIDRVFSMPDSEYGYFAQYFKDGNDRLKGKVPTLIGDSLIVPDASTLIIKSQSRGVFLPTLMSANCFFVVNKTLVEKYGNAFTAHLNEGGMSGLFTQTGSLNADNLNLSLNPFYYDQTAYKSRAQISQLSVRFFSTLDAERAAYKAGSLSIMASPEYDLLTTTEQNDRYVALVSGLEYLGMNYLTKPFDNIKIRQAFALALNKNNIMDGAFKAGTLATNNIIPQEQPGYNQALTGPAGVKLPQGNAALAKNLLLQGMQEEGIKSIDQFPSVTLTYDGGDVVSLHDEMAIIQSQWRNVLGINVKLNDIAGDQLNKYINNSVNNVHGLQLWYSGWIVDYPDPQNWTTLQFSKGSVWNAVNYGQNSSADASAQQQEQANLLKADAMQDPQQRLKAYQDAEQQLVNDVAWLPISQHNTAELVNASVHGYQTNESGIVTPDILAAMSIS